MLGPRRESLTTLRSVYFDMDRCSGCGRCIEACPERNIFIDATLQLSLRKLISCSHCHTCIRVCPTRAVLPVEVKDPFLYDFAPREVLAPGQRPLSDRKAQGRPAQPR